MWTRNREISLPEVILFAEELSGVPLAEMDDAQLIAAMELIGL